MAGRRWERERGENECLQDDGKHAYRSGSGRRRAGWLAAGRRRGRPGSVNVVWLWRLRRLSLNLLLLARCGAGETRRGGAMPAYVTACSSHGGVAAAVQQDASHLTAGARTPPAAATRPAHRLHLPESCSRLYPLSRTCSLITTRQPCRGRCTVLVQEDTYLLSQLHCNRHRLDSPPAGPALQPSSSPVAAEHTGGRRHGNLGSPADD